MLEVQAAIYARVSSEQQAEAHTIASQVAALRTRVAADGLRLATDREFIDEGYSGASLVRPALERLRDLSAGGGIDRLYVHSPDRLARKYAYQVLLLEELRRVGVEVVFLNRELGRTPEDDLLLQVQGMVAEYERAKILERSRRGKRHAAQEGVVSVLSGAPYGYRYVAKRDGAGQARFEILLDEARVVRSIFEGIGRERLSIGEVCRRLNEAGERTPRGKTVWSRSTVGGILRNPAYMGLAAFGKTESGSLRPRLRAQRGRQLQPKRAVSVYDQAVGEWISIPVPAIVTKDLFEVVQEQLDENRARAREGQRGARYLLQGLVVCPLCRYAYYGKAISLKASKGQVRDYAYYRCVGSDAYRFGGQRLCDNPQVRTDRLDEAVWRKVCGLLAEPERLVEEYQRRLQDPGRDRRGDDLATVEAQLRKLRQGIGRLIDSYTDGLIERGDFEPRVRRFKERAAALEEQAQELANEAAMEGELRLLIGRLEDFAATVRGNLDQADWNTRRAIIRTLVKRVEIDKGQVNVVFRVTPGPPPTDSNGPITQDCTGRDGASYNVAKGALEFRVSIPRGHLRPQYGEGFGGAPLSRLKARPDAGQPAKGRNHEPTSPQSPSEPGGRRDV
jgi:site-specific DNA recombinase